METNSQRPHFPEQGQTIDSHRKANRLVHEKSPYLLQHAYNPVDWFPWGEEAFETARKQDKPIFLSIGYSTCHWCHVMEHESFEDHDTAELMNDAFVSIKVDREERPDIDHIYMTVCQMMTGGGGWPLNIIMTPDKRPFFAGTYFPRDSRYGRIGMVDLSRRIKELWTSNRQEILQSAGKILTALRQLPDDSPGMPIDEEILETAYLQLAQRHDERKGGFSQAPKFPTPHNILFLLRHWKRTGSEKALEMVENTLRAMRQGGIYDHVGYGFHRYSTDDEWLVPHFEKMLYDQAMLALAYTEAYQASENAEYERTAREIFAYVMRDMTSPEGGFYSAEDADSEGVEGKFYVWTLDQIQDELDAEDADIVTRVFNLEVGGNFKEEASSHMTGTNILHLKKPLSEIADDLQISEKDLNDILERARKRLFSVRERRIHPQKDDKILTDWNGLMIAALARGSQVFDRAEYALAARKAADFILIIMRGSDGRLLHRFRGGQAGLPAHVDDYAFLIWGLLDLYETLFDVRYLKSALQLNQEFLEHFWDEKAGGFYFTASDGEELLVRKKEIYDGATPSGNSVAALNLLRLARITANTELESMSDNLTRAFSGNVRQLPSAYTQLLSAIEFGIGPSHEVVIAGNLDADDTSAMLRALRKPFLPNKVVILKPSGETDPEISRIATYTQQQNPIDGKATAYICRNYNCLLPTKDHREILELLDAT